MARPFVTDGGHVMKVAGVQENSHVHPAEACEIDICRTHFPNEGK
jgi:hypothetical protein